MLLVINPIAYRLILQPLNDALSLIWSIPTEEQLNTLLFPIEGTNIGRVPHQIPQSAASSRYRNLENDPGYRINSFVTLDLVPYHEDICAELLGCYLPGIPRPSNGRVGCHR